MEIAIYRTKTKESFINLLLDIYGKEYPIDNRQKLYDNLIGQSRFMFEVVEEVHDSKWSYLQLFNGLDKMVNISNAKAILSHRFMNMIGFKDTEDQPNLFLRVAKLLLDETQFDYLSSNIYFNTLAKQVGDWTEINGLIPQTYIMTIEIDELDLIISFNKIYKFTGECQKSSELKIRVDSY
jgi:hypothetical protein